MLFLLKTPSQSSHQATKTKFPDIPSRFLKIPDCACSFYHFSGRLHPPPYSDPLASTFNASISSFKHIQHLQVTTSVFKYIFIQSLGLLTVHLVSDTYANHYVLLAKAKFPDCSLTFQSKQNFPRFPDFPESGNPPSNSRFLAITPTQAEL